jgi:hypothetical protein
MSPICYVPVAFLLVLVLTDRPCPGCGRLLRHRLICPRRPL